MRTKLLLAIAIGAVSIVVFTGTGLIIYTQGSCGQYRIIPPNCSKLLSVTESQEFPRSRQSTIEKLEQARPGLINVYVEPQARCQNKGIVVISHPSERDCDSLNEIIRRDLPDVPYKIINN